MLENSSIYGRLRPVCRAIESRLENAVAEEWYQVLEALQVSVEATREKAVVRGVLPSEAPKFVTIGRTSA
jgi:hypothetical protein